MPKATGPGIIPDLILDFTVIHDPEHLGDDYYAEASQIWGDYARTMADALDRHAPQGLVDALFGELAMRKASIFYVAKASHNSEALEKLAESQGPGAIPHTS